eukprot:GAHX01001563.1.p1 GENE.GAHX01001563.1~~GAHX01001563.1.p1  ORF type:complete len:758 (-),score=122.61 GAHX01001563.1:5-2206(-)
MDYSAIKDTQEDTNPSINQYTALSKSSIRLISSKLDQKTKLTLPLLNRHFNGIHKTNHIITSLNLYTASTFICTEIMTSLLFNSGYFNGLVYLSLENCKGVSVDSFKKIFQHFPLLRQLNLTRCSQVGYKTAKMLTNSLLNLNYIELYKTALTYHQIIDLYKSTDIKLGFALVKACCKEKLAIPNVCNIWPRESLRGVGEEIHKKEYGNNETVKSYIFGEDKCIEEPKLINLDRVDELRLGEVIKQSEKKLEDCKCVKSNSIASPCFGDIKVVAQYSLNASLTRGPFPISQISLCAKHFASTRQSRCDYCRFYYTEGTVENFLCSFCMDKSLFMNYKNSRKEDVSINTMVNKTINISQEKNFKSSLIHIKNLDFPELNSPKDGSTSFLNLVKINEEPFDSIVSEIKKLNSEIKTKGYKETWFVKDNDSIKTYGSYEKNIYSNNIGIGRFVQTNYNFFFYIIATVILLVALINSFQFYKEIKISSELVQSSSPFSIMANNGGPALPFLFLCNLVVIPFLIWLGSRFITFVLFAVLPMFILVNMILSMGFLGPVFDLILFPFNLGIALKIYVHINFALLLLGGIFKTYRSPSHIIAVIFLYTYIGSVLGTAVSGFFMYIFLLALIGAFYSRNVELMGIEFFFRNHAGNEEYLPNIFLSKNHVVLRPFEIILVPALIGTVGVQTAVVFVTALVFIGMLGIKMMMDNADRDNKVKFIYYFAVVLTVRYVSNWMNAMF